MRPARAVAADSRLWRRHSLLTLRYVEGLDADKAAAQLGISRSEMFRDQRLAVEAVASLLWVRWGMGGETSEPARSEPVQRDDAEAASRPDATSVGRLFDLAPVELPVPWTSFVGREEAVGRGPATPRDLPPAHADRRRRLRQDQTRARGCARPPRRLRRRGRLRRPGAALRPDARSERGRACPRHQGAVGRALVTTLRGGSATGAAARPRQLRAPGGGVRAAGRRTPPSLPWAHDPGHQSGGAAARRRSRLASPFAGRAAAWLFNASWRSRLGMGRYHSSSTEPVRSSPASR